ncbi:MAG TPA: type I-MYXAN CRISPR-associated protein Cas6/Cmx6 [Gammaproteobacteria bacterium]|nr:type I-MYXAN CRISPR-associated protein Cas6/Cmx6 [Gammaproteobacteria bacterium]
MFWEEEREENPVYRVPDDVVDVVYSIRCKCLPLDHAHSFSRAVCDALPWMETEAQAGIHLIHGAESGNGWMRPEDPERELLYLSRRSRMSLRVPRHRVDEALALAGTVFDIEGHRLEVGEGKTRRFSTQSTQFARYVVVPGEIGHEDEEAFLRWAAEQARGLDVRVRKMLCGRAHVIRHPDGELYTRSLMLADLEAEEAVRLQQSGIGSHRKMGCGLFLPHKGIRAVHEVSADQA